MLNPEAYKDYYCNCQQQGGAYFPVYAGSLTQRGGGLGSIFSSIFRSVTPLLKRGASAIGKVAMRTGKSLVKDLARGKPVHHSLRKHGSKALKRLASEAIDHITKPTEPTPAPAPRSQVKKKRKKINRKDIFS